MWGSMGKMWGCRVAEGCSPRRIAHAHDLARGHSSGSRWRHGLYARLDALIYGKYRVASAPPVFPHGVAILLQPATAPWITEKMDKSSEVGIGGEVTEKRDEFVLPELQEYHDLQAKFDENRVKSLLRRVDVRLMPPLAILYLVAFIDRSNIGNARLQGLEKDLNLSPQQYAWCLTIFFFPYALFEVPSNIMLKLLRPSIWLTIIVFGWGIIMTVMGLCQNYSALLACRFFLGVFEAGLFPGCTFITTAWYKRFEVQYRVALFYSAASLSGAFSGLLAFAIGNMTGVRGYSGWRWLFILEGIATCVVASICYFFIPDSPGSAKWLSPEEARFLELRLQFDGHDKGYKEGGFEWKYLIQGFTDAKVYIGTRCQRSTSHHSPSTLWLYHLRPQLSPVRSLQAPRRLHHRPMRMTMIGLIIGMAVDPTKLPGVIYFALFLVAGGIFSGIPTTVAWTSNNLAGQWKRAVGMALQFTLGNLVGGTVGSNIFLVKEKPKYMTAYSVLFSVTACAFLSGWALLFCIRRWNAQKAALVEQAEREGRDLDAERKDLGDKNPYFKYTL
ncbi:MFS transporter [Coccidioides immitis H538.4]|uniref:MFS transporter n=1 Tax=Coccidioides immitis H538.4 TaxID=396776 RepID=A0A0J8RNE1_COCIT|nr:MFS transporter [Coccidioides immitis H538.4]